jgi:hypothetical protein
MDTEIVDNNDDFQLVENKKKTPKPQRVTKKYKKPTKAETAVTTDATVATKQPVLSKVNKQLTKKDILLDYYYPKSGSRFEVLGFE